MLVETIVGPKVSGTVTSVTSSERPTLPPVSVARTCSCTEPPRVGAWVNMSNGKLGSLLTTLPLTSSSTLRICTSSDTSGVTCTEPPASTWIPGVPGSASPAATEIFTVGATPLVSNPM